MQRPKIAYEAFARIQIQCRVCDATVEAYVLDILDPKEPTIYDSAFVAAGKMAKHLQEEHDYPKRLFTHPVERRFPWA